MVDFGVCLYMYGGLCWQVETGGEGVRGVLYCTFITRMHFHCQLGSSKVNPSSIIFYINKFYPLL